MWLNYHHLPEGGLFLITLIYFFLVHRDELGFIAVVCQHLLKFSLAARLSVFQTLVVHLTKWLQQLLYCFKYSPIFKQPWTTRHLQCH